MKSLLLSLALLSTTAGWAKRVVVDSVVLTSSGSFQGQGPMVVVLDRWRDCGYFSDGERVTKKEFYAAYPTFHNPFPDLDACISSHTTRGSM